MGGKCLLPGKQAGVGVGGGVVGRGGVGGIVRREGAGGGGGRQKVSLREMDSKKRFVQSSPLRPVICNRRLIDS